MELTDKNISYSNLTKKEKIKLLYDLHDYTISLRDQLGFQKDFTYGIEMELMTPNFEGPDETRVMLFNIWFQRIFRNEEFIFTRGNEMKNHGWTLGIDEGVDAEISSPIYHDELTSYQELKKVCDKLRKEGVTTGTTTSLQVNIGGQIFQKSYRRFKNAFLLYALFEDVLYYFSKEEKNYRFWINTYARPIAYKIIPATSFYLSDSTWENFVRKATYGIPFFDKESGINISKLKIKKDFLPENLIEVRIPDGTINEIKIQNMINAFGKLFQSNIDEVRLLLAYRKYVKRMSKETEFIHENHDYLSANFDKSLELCDLIFDNNLDKLNFLKQYIKKEDYEKIEKVLRYY